MSAVEYKTEQEIQTMGIDILYNGLGATDFIRFMQHKIKVMETMLKTVSNGRKITQSQIYLQKWDITNNCRLG